MAFNTALDPIPTPTIWPQRARPLVPIVVGLCLAILLAEWGAHTPLWGISALASLTATCAGLAYRSATTRSLWLAVACTLPLGYAYTLWSIGHLPANHISRHLVSTPVTLDGRVLSVRRVSQATQPPESHTPHASRTFFDLSASALSSEATGRIHVSGRVRVTAYDFDPQLEPGDVVRLLHIRLRRPSGFRNPGGFDYGRYLERQGIYATGSLSKAERLEGLQRAPDGPLKRLAAIKNRLATQMQRAMSAPAAAIAQEMVLGIRGGLTPEVREAFAASGTAHLMSVSGLHVGFIYAAVFFVLKPALLQLRFRLLARLSGGPRPSKLAAAGGLLAVLGYACLIGPNLPTVRATLMISTYVLAYLLDRDGDPWQTTALAAVLILMVSPWSLFDLGFLLSFAGVLSILYAQTFLRRREPLDASATPAVSLRARVSAKLRGAILIAVFASLGTAPIILYAFQRLPLIAPLANIVVVPWASLAVPLTLVGSLTAELIPALGEPLLAITGLLIEGMYGLIASFAALPYAAPRLGAVSMPEVMLAYGTLLLWGCSRRFRLARWGAAACTLGVSLWVGWPWMYPEGRDLLQVTFLDVGHGDASVIRFPQGTTMLIDGGGSYREDIDIGARVVAPFLWSQRIRRIDHVVATHPHPDHARGLGYILDHFRVRQFWDNEALEPAPWYGMLRQQATERGIYRGLDLHRGTTWNIDGVSVERLHPDATAQPHPQRRRRGEDADENNRSLVLKLTYGSVSFLFTGDIEEEAERVLLGGNCDVRSTILKVPHHGSRTSSSKAFIRAVDPLVAVFSVQRDSRFGHPHPAVVERYQTQGTRLFRTDMHGAISVRTDGQFVWIEPFLGEAVQLPVATSSASTAGFTTPAAVAPPTQSAPSRPTTLQATSSGSRTGSSVPPSPDIGGATRRSAPGCR